MINEDISVNLYQKCLMFDSNILQEVLCNMSLQFVLQWQHARLHTSMILKEFICLANNELYALSCLFYSYLELGELGSLR